MSVIFTNEFYQCLMCIKHLNTASYLFLSLCIHSQLLLPLSCIGYRRRMRQMSSCRTDEKFSCIVRLSTGMFCTGSTHPSGVHSSPSLFRLYSPTLIHALQPTNNVILVQCHLYIIQTPDTYLLSHVIGKENSSSP